MKISELLSEGYVQRNGAAFSLFGLRLHFYRDHVFYVVKDGPNISIYRDGASIPRNDEIYVKDAAARGVPKDIIQVISYWLNTPDDKQPSLLPRIEQALEHIAGTWLKQHAAKKEDVDEALLSPRVHEIFLKGLIGAILSGGFSLGLDYAKEKTADLDKKGLQAVYKSIDPREYPELTKRLTPRDKEGLNAILGKLKEHAMRMEELLAEGGNKENKAKKNAILKPSMRPKKQDKTSTFDPRDVISGVRRGRKVAEDSRPVDNFTIDDIKKLERITDLNKMKMFAKQLISTPSKKPIRPEKVAWLTRTIDSKKSPMQVIKLMYDLLLGGEGSSVIGSRHSTDPNSYRKAFGEDTSAADSITDGNDRRKYIALRNMEADRLAKAKATKNSINQSHHRKMAQKHNDDANAIMNKYRNDTVSEDKKKGADGKACWKGYKYAGTENGKDKCVKSGK